jgi:hypothetical protein
MIRVDLSDATLNKLNFRSSHIHHTILGFDIPMKDGFLKQKSDVFKKPVDEQEDKRFFEGSSPVVDKFVKIPVQNFETIATDRPLDRT